MSRPDQITIWCERVCGDHAKKVARVSALSSSPSQPRRAQRITRGCKHEGVFGKRTYRAKPPEFWRIFAQVSWLKRHAWVSFAEGKEAELARAEGHGSSLFAAVSAMHSGSIEGNEHVFKVAKEGAHFLRFQHERSQ
eukprot:3771801-Rhodomonas_salina.2